VAFTSSRLSHADLDAAIPRIVDAIGRLSLCRRADGDQAGRYSKACERIGNLASANGSERISFGQRLPIGEARYCSEARDLDP
jgi:hypothetical protein